MHTFSTCKLLLKLINVIIILTILSGNEFYSLYGTRSKSSCVCLLMGQLLLKPCS
jgi:hypothetical protein